VDWGKKNVRRNLGILVIVLISSVAGRAEETCLFCRPHCTVPPPPRCPDCSTDACDHRLILCGLRSPDHASRLLEALASDDFCKRRNAVEKLGCRLHADVCSQPAVLDALLQSLQCDKCWEVRRAAAWSLFGQRARTEAVVLALYISSRIDPHYMVRIRSAEALDLLTVGKRECYTELYKAADQLLRVLKSKGYQPGRDCCLIRAGTACGPDGSLSVSTTLPGETGDKEQLTPPTPEPEKVPVEKIPAGK
jgi:hypothetical protein